MEIKEKEEIIKASNAIKRKLKDIRDFETDNKKMYETVFKPIIKPLNEMKNNISSKEENTSNKNINFEFKRRCHSSDKKPGELKSEKNFDLINNSDEEDVFEDVQDIDDNSSVSDDNCLDKTIIDRPLELNDIIDNDIFSPTKSTPKKNDDNNKESVPFGIRTENGKYFIGNHPVKLTNDLIIIDNTVYKRTPGMDELLFKKDSNRKLITSEDANNYKMILLKTNTHHRDYDPSKPIKSSKGQKYLKIIKPLLNNQKINSQAKESKGKGLKVLRLLKRLNKNTDYVYWDDPNELVDRLRLLLASREAGNTGLENEIISIIEELRESKIIE